LKRILQIALVFTWLLSIAGVVVSRHYCGPFLKNVELGHSTKHCCMDAADEPNDCCENTTEYQSLDGSFVKVEKLALGTPSLFVLYAIELPDFLSYDEAYSTHSLSFATDTGPPLPLYPAYISFGALLI
tara:strand:- start:26507 stop:26893 length:387 start_codon:yes stop_codon:yes gene_type:complete